MSWTTEMQRREMGRLEYGISRLICNIFSHHYINVNWNEESVGVQCMRCWKIMPDNSTTTDEGDKK